MSFQNPDYCPVSKKLGAMLRDPDRKIHAEIKEALTAGKKVFIRIDPNAPKQGLWEFPNPYPRQAGAILRDPEKEVYAKIKEAVDEGRQLFIRAIPEEK